MRIITPAHPQTLAEHVSQHRDALVASALDSGALLFRGFNVCNFEHDIKSFEFLDYDYIGGAAIRTKVRPGVYTANDSPSDKVIPFHHELGQVRRPPTHLFFYCHTPPRARGQTPLVDSRRIAQYVRSAHPEFFERLQRGVTYTRFMGPDDDPLSPIGRSWRNTFRVRSKREAELCLEESDMAYEWLKHDVLKTTTPAIPAVVYDKRASAYVFKNSIVAAHTGWTDAKNVGSKAVRFADGSLLESEIVRDICDEMRRARVEFDWQKGDVLMIDNTVMMHARNPFVGPRKILVSMKTDPCIAQA